MSTRTLSRLRLSAVALVLIFLPLAASAGEAPEGRWEGSIEMPNRSIQVIVELLSSEGGWLGDIEIPGQTPVALPIDSIQIGDGKVVLGVSKIPGNPTFTGMLSEDGQTLAGDFAQGGSTASFSLALNADVAPEVAEPDPYRYVIDSVHTSAGFSVRHFTVSNVKGNFKKISGIVSYNPEDLSASGVEVEIDAASIDTDHEQRDGHLKSADFLHVEENPTITFKSTAVEKTADGLRVTGDLTIRGVSREVSFPFTMVGPIKDPLGMMRMGIEGSLTIDRREWGLEWNRTMETGGLFVGHNVKIELNAEATQI